VGLDRALNAATDWSNRVLPWVWWPATPPRRRHRYGPEHHAVMAGWLVLSTVAGEVHDRRDTDMGPVERQALRLGGVAGYVGTWWLFARAWNRRADRLRRPWVRLLG
jgi:hypothetical protein